MCAVLNLILHESSSINIQHNKVYAMLSGCVAVWVLKPNYKCTNIYFTFVDF